VTNPKAITGPHSATTATAGAAAAVVENVVYTYDPGCQPAIQYHSIPSSCAGGANTLHEARSSYRTQMAGLLNVDRHELPSVIEHLEAVVAGMWVRTKVGAIHRGRDADRMFLQILVSRGQAQDALRAHLDSATAAGDAPVVVIVEPDDTLGTVLDQMTTHDALLVAYSDMQTAVGWIAIYGAQADAANHVPQTFEHAGLRDMPIDTFIRTHATANSRAVRVRPYPPRDAVLFQFTRSRPPGTSTVTGHLEPDITAMAPRADSNDDG
jgi:hypothetical protein